jgi:hypothetical protein
MEESKSARLREQAKTVEQAYRRGYHHGLSRAREVLLRLLNEGMPAPAAMELCRVFVIWRKFCQGFATILGARVRIR